MYNITINLEREHDCAVNNNNYCLYPMIFLFKLPRSPTVYPISRFAANLTIDNNVGLISDVAQISSTLVDPAKRKRLLINFFFFNNL